MCVCVPSILLLQDERAWLATCLDRYLTGTYACAVRTWSSRPTSKARMRYASYAKIKSQCARGHAADMSIPGPVWDSARKGCRSTGHLQGRCGSTAGTIDKRIRRMWKGWNCSQQHLTPKAVAKFIRRNLTIWHCEPGIVGNSILLAYIIARILFPPYCNNQPRKMASTINKAPAQDIP